MLTVTDDLGGIGAAFTTSTVEEIATEPGDIGSLECRQVQLEAQAAVEAGMPYGNHGQMVSTAAKVVSSYSWKTEGGITCECASCIMHQFAHRTPIAEQEPCGTDSPDPECEPATCETFVPCNNPGGCSQPICISTAEGLGVCVDGTTSCDALLPCTVTADCPAENYCAVETCCGTPVCMAESTRCGGTAPATTNAASAGCGASGPSVSSP